MDTRIYESSRLLPQYHLAQNNPTQKSLTIPQILIEQKKLIGLLENGQINQPNFKKDLDTLRTHIVDATVYSPRTEDKETMLKLSAALERVYSIPDLPDSEFKGLAKKTLLEMIKDSNDPKQPETTSTPIPSQPETTPTSRPSTGLFPVHENQIADGSPVSIEKLKHRALWLFSDDYTLNAVSLLLDRIAKGKEKISKSDLTSFFKKNDDEIYAKNVVALFNAEIYDQRRDEFNERLAKGTISVLSHRNYRGGQSFFGEIRLENGDVYKFMADQMETVVWNIKYEPEEWRTLRLPRDNADYNFYPFAQSYMHQPTSPSQSKLRESFDSAIETYKKTKPYTDSNE